MQTEARQVAAAGITVNLVLVKSWHTLPAAELAQAIAAAALYFASEESAFVTGQTLQLGVGSSRK